MTLVIRPGTPGKLILAQTYIGIDDPDAAAYIAAVELADQQSLETATKVAIHSFIKGCKRDGIWPAIKACCILTGARTLAGALVPLVGTAPTNFNFVSGDYNRKTGLVGDASTKYLNSNRALNADPQNNSHFSVYVSTAASSGHGLIGNDDVPQNTGESGIYRNSSVFTGRSRNSFGFAAPVAASTTGLIAFSRSVGASIDFRGGGSTSSIAYASLGSASSLVNIAVFSRDLTNAASRSNPRLAFYSIGESLDLALLDTRVTALINALAVAIP